MVGPIRVLNQSYAKLDMEVRPEQTNCSSSDLATGEYLEWASTNPGRFPDYFRFVGACGCIDHEKPRRHLESTDCELRDAPVSRRL